MAPHSFSRSPHIVTAPAAATHLALTMEHAIFTEGSPTPIRPSQPATWRRLLGKSAELVGRVLHRRWRGNAVYSLSQLDDRTLKDLGIHRSEIPAIEADLRRRQSR